MCSWNDWKDWDDGYDSDVHGPSYSAYVAQHPPKHPLPAVGVPEDLCEEYKKLKMEFASTARFRLGQYAPFVLFQKKALEQGCKACPNFLCPHGVQLLDNFHNRAASNDGKATECKSCCNPAQQAAEENFRTKRKLDISHALSEKKSKCMGHTEDEAMAWLQPKLEKWINVQVCPELRRGDFAVRFADWTNDVGIQMHLPVQLKSSTGTPDFSSCCGYSDMLLVLVNTERKENGDVTRTLWWCWGDDVVHKSGGLHANDRGQVALGNERFLEPKSESDLPELVREMEKRSELRRSWPEIWLDLNSKKPRKEMIYMMAMDQISPVLIKSGYSTVVDCTWFDLLTQVKGAHAVRGEANVCHMIHSCPDRPYHIRDGIQLLVEPLIVKSGDNFYLLYARQPLHELLRHKVFGHNGYEELPAHPGRSRITVPLGKNNGWMHDKKPKQGNSKTAWLTDTEFGWNKPVLLTPRQDYTSDRIGDWLTLDLLNEVAHVAARPDLCPV